MEDVIKQISDRQKKPAVVDLRSGDSVKVHQKIREGGKERVQIFEGLVLRVTRRGSLSSTFTVRRIASGVGVEKTFLIHSPNILKIEILKRTKVRRNYLSYMRQLTGKGTRLTGVEFDKTAVHAATAEAEAEEARLKDRQAKEHEEQAAKEAEEKAKEEAKAEAALAKHQAKAEAEKTEEPDKEK